MSKSIQSKKPRHYNPEGKRAYLNKKITVKKPAKTSVAAVKQAGATYKRVMKIARETPYKRTREGILYKDMAEMLKARGKPLTVGQLVRLPRKQAVKLIKKYNEYDPVRQFKDIAYKTKKSIATALGSRSGNADFLKKIKRYSGGELYSLVIQKNHDINKFLFSNSPNDVILRDGSTEAADDMESMILEMLEGA